MLRDIGRAIAILDADTRRALWPLLFTFGLIAALDALGIGLVFPVMLSLFAPDAAPGAFASDGFLDRLTGWLPVDGAALGLVAILVFLVKNVLSAWLVGWQYSVLSRAEARMGTRLFERYLRDPWRSTSQRNSSEMMRNASVSTSHLFLSYLIPLMTLAVEGLLVVAVFAMLLLVDARVAVSAAVLLALAGGIYFALVHGRLRSVGRDFQKANLDLLLHLKQGLAAGREIRVLGREAEFVDQVASARALYAEAQARRAFYTQLPRYYLESVLVVTVAVAVVIALPARAPGELSAIMALFAVAALRLMTSANRILGALQQVRMGVEAMRIVHADLTRTDADLPKPRPGVVEPPLDQGLSLRGVAFSYLAEGAPALHDVSFDLPDRGSLGIVGPSGSGKSTLVDVLLGLLPPDAGAVLHDGVNIQSDLRAWRRLIGFVPQTISLTDDSLRRNVAFGLPDHAIDEAAVWAALRMAQLEELVATLPQGLDTPLGDLGARLSGGQRQRVGIARALYHDPRILVLDEATSALDGETEQAVVAAIEALAERKTLIVVAHRLSTVRRCDRLLVLEGGRVAGLGPTEEVMRENAVVQRLLGRAEGSAAP